MFIAGRKLNEQSLINNNLIIYQEQAARQAGGEAGLG
jgi:hypothetical protein